jgi:hypothetical protein
MSDRDAIKNLHELLKHKDKWYINPSAPDNPVLIDVCEKAKAEADKRLSEMSFRSLYKRYEEWYKTQPPFIELQDYKGDYFSEFLNDVVFNLGTESLKDKEKQWYLDSCNLTLHFI